MDSKKSGMLRHLRQKIMRGKLSSGKRLAQLKDTMDSRMSSSVPDMRDLDYAPVSPSTQLQQYTCPSHSSPSTPLTRSARGLGGGGSGLVMRAGGAGRSVAADCTDWASSQESFSSLCVEERRSPDSYSRPGRGMEAEELALPEMMTVYSSDSPSFTTSQYDVNNFNGDPLKDYQNISI